VTKHIPRFFYLQDVLVIDGVVDCLREIVMLRVSDFAYELILKGKAEN
jgi:hypothetical protein